MTDSNGPHQWQRPSTWLTAILLISFFLPWISIGGLISVAGYKIPDAVRGVADINSAFDQEREVTRNLRQQIVYALYLIPVLSGIALYLAIARNRSSYGWKICASLVTPLCVLTYFGSDLKKIFDIFGFGAWVALATSASLFCAALVEAGKKRQVDDLSVRDY